MPLVFLWLKGGAVLERKYLSKLWVLFAVFVIGCDPIRTTQQLVGVKLVDSASGRPVVGAQLSLKFDYAATTMPQEWDLTPDEWREYAKEASLQFPWFHGVTSAEGLCTLNLTWDLLDRNKGPTPTTDSDFVTGKPYRVKVEERRLPIEEFSVLMKPGVSATTGAYTITVVDITAPRYVDVEDPF